MKNQDEPENNESGQKKTWAKPEVEVVMPVARTANGPFLHPPGMVEDPFYKIS